MWIMIQQSKTYITLEEEVMNQVLQAVSSGQEKAF